MHLLKFEPGTTICHDQSLFSVGVSVCSIFLIDKSEKSAWTISILEHKGLPWIRREKINQSSGKDLCNLNKQWRIEKAIHVSDLLIWKPKTSSKSNFQIECIRQKRRSPLNGMNPEECELELETISTPTIASIQNSLQCLSMAMSLWFEQTLCRMCRRVRLDQGAINWLGGLDERGVKLLCFNFQLNQMVGKCRVRHITNEASKITSK